MRTAFILLSQSVHWDLFCLMVDGHRVRHDHKFVWNGLQ